MAKVRYFLVNGCVTDQSPGSIGLGSMIAYTLYTSI